MNTRALPPLGEYLGKDDDVRRKPGGTLAGFWTATAWGFRLSFTLKRIVPLVLLACLGGYIVGQDAEGANPYASDPWYKLWNLYDQQVFLSLLPLCSLLVIAPGFSREVSNRTLVYHLVRPISRKTLYLARYVAGIPVAWLLAVALLASTAAASGLELPVEVWMSFPGVALLGVMLPGAFYYLLAALFRRGLIAGLVYTFLFEQMFSAAKGQIQYLSMSFYVRSLHHGLTDPVFRAESVGVDRELSRTQIDFGAIVANGASPQEMAAQLTTTSFAPWTDAILYGSIITLVALGLGMLLVSHRNFPLKD